MSGSADTVAVVRTGTANLASVAVALRRSARKTVLIETAEQVAAARLLVLPGVGTFAAAMARLETGGLVAALRERVAEGRPTLAICLGMQLLAETSEESPGHAGLGVLPLRARRLDGDVRVPQMGWNLVEPDKPWVPPGWAYFAHSYCVDGPAPPGWSSARTCHGRSFLSVLARGRVLACQFHPELSGDWGERLLRWWLDGGEA